MISAGPIEHKAQIKTKDLAHRNEARLAQHVSKLAAPMTCTDAWDQQEEAPAVG